MSGEPWHKLRGRFLVIDGPDGAGKTTTMRLLTAVLEPTGGAGWV